MLLGISPELLFFSGAQVAENALPALGPVKVQLLGSQGVANK